MVPGKFTKKQRDALGELEKLAKRLGMRVSFGNLKFAGLNLKGGHCRLKEEKWLVVDRRRSFEEQVDIFREALGQFELSEEDTPPVLKRFFPPIIKPAASEDK
ncbi:MAG: hypothetical protein V1816_07415 [Pseudomonadota bacterium]